MQVITVNKCQRCNFHHENLEFNRLNNAVDGYEWYAICPITKQPLLMAVEHITNLPTKQVILYCANCGTRNISNGICKDCNSSRHVMRRDTTLIKL